MNFISQEANWIETLTEAHRFEWTLLRFEVIFNNFEHLAFLHFKIGVLDEHIILRWRKIQLIPCYFMGKISTKNVFF